MIPKYSTSALLTFGLALTGIGWTVPASATVLNIPAISLIPKDAAPLLGETFGLLDANGESGVYVAPVNIAAGQQVCKFELWARDFDSLDMSARLMRKQLQAAVDNDFGPAVQTMAEVFSSSSTDGIQKWSTNDVAFPGISNSYIYWVELEFTGGFYQALALKVTYKSAC